MTFSEASTQVLTRIDFQTWPTLKNFTVETSNSDTMEDFNREIKTLKSKLRGYVEI